jgi:hypothetical protein
VSHDCELGSAVLLRLQADQELLERLLATNRGLSNAEKGRLTQLKLLADKGLEEYCRRRPKQQEEIVEFARLFLEHGSFAIFSAGAQRGGDFLLNQLRGRWAEEVVVSMSVEGMIVKPFGPTGAAMPGEEDYRRIRQTFDAISRLEGKRPDVIGFDVSVYEGFKPEEQARIDKWPKRPLDDLDQALIKEARVGIEVKNSTWCYVKRRAAGGDALSVTVKQEELEILRHWEEKYAVPIIFVQVLFDEAYCMSFKRMREFITAKPNKRRGPYQDGDYYRDEQSGAKVYHHFYTGLTDQSYRCADVTFPKDSVAEVRALEGGNVIPYIKFAPAEATSIRSDVIWREISY